jgi:hypothetical protein
MSIPELGFGPTGASRSAGRPTVVELVGVAASGKTSLLHALGRGDPTLQAGLRPPRIRHMAQILPLLPTFLALHWPYRGLLRKEMKRITYLRTVYGMLHGELPGRPRAVILDEGPVYMLARLRVYGGERIRTATFERWWRGTVAQWARTVDLIVWLDAPDITLLQRSRTRDQVHQLQRLSEVRAQQFLAAYRQAYETVVGALTELSGPAVLRVRSDQQSVEAIRDQVLAEIRFIGARRSG